MDELTLEALIERKQQVEDSLPDDTALRLHRSLSWLRRAYKQQDDDDSQFIFFWLSFNALYAREKQEPADYFESERDACKMFCEKIAHLDCDNQIYDALWKTFSSPIRNLLRNKYVYQPFWNHLNGCAGEVHWETRFQKAQEIGLQALQSGNSCMILQLLFDRLYVLRNQIFHGSATWRSSVNREQIKDAKNILAMLLPIVLDLMLRNPQTNWGPPCYRVVE